MNKTNLIMLLGLIFLAMPFVYGADYTFKQNTLVDLKIPVYDSNNAKATNAISCYLTVTSPTQAMVVDDATMTFMTGGWFNYTILSLSELGTYPSSMSCTDGTTPGYTVFSIEVTTTGQGNGNNVPLFLLIGGFLVLALALYQRNEYFGFFAASIFIVSYIYMMRYGFGLVSDTYTQTIAYIALGLGLIIGLGSTLEVVGQESGESDDD